MIVEVYTAKCRPALGSHAPAGEQEVVELERKGCLDSIKSFRQHTTANEEDDEEVRNRIDFSEVVPFD